MTEQFKKSVGAITAPRELKDTIFENILTKAETAQTPKQNNVLKFIPYAAVAALAIGVFGLHFNATHLPSAVNDSADEFIDGKSSLLSLDITPYEYFDEILLTTDIPKTIELISYQVDETELSLFFNVELQIETNNISSDKYIETIKEYYLSVMQDLETINIYSDNQLIKVYNK